MSLKNPNVVNPKHKKCAAIVISNPAVSTTAGWPAGFWWSELSHPLPSKEAQQLVTRASGVR
jgi:hypothetical protein